MLNDTHHSTLDKLTCRLTYSIDNRTPQDRLLIRSMALPIPAIEGRLGIKARLTIFTGETDRSLITLATSIASLDLSPVYKSHERLVGVGAKIFLRPNIFWRVEDINHKHIVFIDHLGGIVEADSNGGIINGKGKMPKGIKIQ